MIDYYKALSGGFDCTLSSELPVTDATPEWMAAAASLRYEVRVEGLLSDMIPNILVVKMLSMFSMFSTCSSSQRLWKSDPVLRVLDAGEIAPIYRKSTFSSSRRDYRRCG